MNPILTSQQQSHIKQKRDKREAQQALNDVL